MLLSTKEINPAQELDNKGRFINVDYIYELLNRLPTQDRKIVELFYGINRRAKNRRRNFKWGKDFTISDRI